METSSRQPFAPPCRQQFLRQFRGRVRWVFGYGSLMWNPGFPCAESRPAKLHGYHRALCLWSVRYRGTPDNPGLVAGLVPGGCCRGMALRFAAAAEERVLGYLFERELVSYAYRPLLKRCRLENGSRVEVLVFVSRTDHQQYAAPMPAERAAAIVGRASGPHGSNRAYVERTVSRLNALGIRQSELHRIASLLA